MKSWVKGMLIGAAACVGVGSTVCVCAWAMGGRFSHYRNRSYGWVEQLAEAGDTEGGKPEEFQVHEEGPIGQDYGTGISGGASVSSGNGALTGVPSSSGREAKTEGSAGVTGSSAGEARSGGTVVRELEIQVMGGWVEITTDDSVDQIVVTSSNEDYVCRQELDEDKLEIRVSLNTGLWQNWLNGRDDGDFEDEEDLAARILIPSGAGFQEVDLEVKGGVLHMDQVAAGKLSLDVEVGTAEVSAGSVQELDGECKMGELIYKGQVGQEMEAECATGSIQYLIDGAREDFTYELECGAGSIAIDGTEEGVLNRENVIHNPGAVKRAKLECKAGAIDVEFQ